MPAVPKQRSLRTDERTRGEPSKSARTRERILDAAAKVLNRNGYAGTRLSDIAALAQAKEEALFGLTKVHEFHLNLAARIPITPVQQPN